MGDEVLELQPGNDHVARLAHRGDPLRAVVELVWNAVDADADDVHVKFARGEGGAIEEVHVSDDGHGIDPDERRTTFGMIGGSWKRAGRRTKGGKRLLHGERGEGRLRAFALGDQVEWVSHARDAMGVVYRVRISGNSSDYRRFPSSAEPTTGQRETGTLFRAFNTGQLGLSALDSQDAIPGLLAHFAPLLVNEPALSLVYDGTRLDPGEHIAFDTAYDLKELPGRASVRVIEWRSAARSTPRNVYFGADGTHFPYEESAVRLEPHIPFTAYVTWDGLGPDELAVIGLREMAQEPVATLWRSVDARVREHFVLRRRQQRRNQIRQWQKSGAYPYTGKPANETEKAERAVFDAITGALAPHIAPEKDKARLTLTLLQGALRHDPGSLTTILHEVVALSPEDAATFTQLLQETTLPGIIHAANLVAGRRKVLAGLHHLLFDPEDSQHVGERAHLHKILERELWVLGEGYSVMRSEKGLTDLARTHLKLSGLDGPTRPVVRADGRSGRVDVHLAVRDMQHDRIRNLVVELKAPELTVGRRELDQVEDYANAILDNPVFASPRSQWDFVLLTTAYDDIAGRRRVPDRNDGLVWQSSEQGKPRVRTFLRSWSDVLDENSQRLDFLSRELELDPSVSDGLRFVQDNYPDLLPEGIQNSGVASA